MITRHAAPARSPAGPWIAVGTAGAICLLAVIVATGPTSRSVPARDAVPVGGPATGDGAASQVGTAVYRYAKDTPKPSRSACTGGCATTWPPLLDTGVPALTGVAPTRVGTIRRADGTRQITLDGWPLYRFAEDVRPGDRKGDGVGGAWRLVAGTSPVTVRAAAPTAAPPTTARAAAPTTTAPTTTRTPAPAESGY